MSISVESAYKRLVEVDSVAWDATLTGGRSIHFSCLDLVKAWDTCDACNDTCAKSIIRQMGKYLWLHKSYLKLYLI